MIKQAGIAVAAVLILTCAALGQDGRWDVSANAVGMLSKQSSGNQVVLTPTQGYGVVGSAQMRLASRFSLQVNAGHAHNSQKYATGTLDYRIQSTITEFSGALVFRLFETAKWKPFLFGGAGALVFNPNSTLILNNSLLSPGETPESIGAARQTRIAILYGGGVDRPLLPHLFLRLQYRGLVYSPPDFTVSGLFTGGQGHVAEPSIGLAFKF